jgi:hypothetical protein
LLLANNSVNVSISYAENLFTYAARILPVLCAGDHERLKKETLMLDTLLNLFRASLPVKKDQFPQISRYERLASRHQNLAKPPNFGV